MLLQFQKIYFIAFYPALFADWLNAPYVYKLFSHYGFLEDQITIIYVCGMVSALFVGTSSGYLIHTFNEQRVALVASAVYALACFLKLSSDYRLVYAFLRFSSPFTVQQIISAYFLLGPTGS